MNNIGKKERITIEEVLSHKTHPEHRVVHNFRDLRAIVKQLKKAGYRIVLTQGVWDLIHEGHALYLEAAKKRGDILIVGVDSDELTRRRKGPRRPIVPETERIRMISRLRDVDIITVRQVHHDIGKLIHVVEPDVLVVSKSTKDFTKQMKKQYNSVCGEVADLQPKATTSTSARIRNMTIEGAEKLAEEINKLTKQFIEDIKNGD